MNGLKMNGNHVNHIKSKPSLSLSKIIGYVEEDILILITLASTYFFRFLLWLIGWKQMNPAICEKAKVIEKAVVIFPHTSSWDFMVLILYKFSNPVVFKDVYIVVKPQFFEGPLKGFFKYLKCIPATKYEQKGGGFIKRTTDLFKNKERFHIMISPEGRRIKTAWQSGYYRLSEQLKCPVYIVGTCYYRKEIMFFGPFNKNPLEPLLSFENRIKERAKLIVPLIPENKFVGTSESLLNKIKNKKPTLINKKKVIFRVLVLVSMFVLKILLFG